MPKIKLRQNPWQPRDASKPMGPRCPYCGSSGTHPLKAFTADGFQQYRCSSCLKTFEKKL
ncbi:MAG: transposase [Thaumarchaeota archaeon]|nr:transposase [Nitrososphaerota archaeon]